MYHSAAPSDTKGHCIGNYILLQTIGYGAFASVCLARHTVTGRQVAVKVMSRQGLSDPPDEVRALQELHHPNITQLFEVITTRNNVYLILEHVSGGDLFDYLRNRGRMTEEEARTTLRQLISALHYCHQRGIIHRDIKPENILIDGEKNIRLADFGLSAVLKHQKLRAGCGTLPYMAPEMLRQEPYDEKADVWSVGVVLYQMLTRRIPFRGKTGEEQKSILRGRFHVPTNLSQECNEL